jgi:hypothetical protein
VSANEPSSAASRSGDVARIVLRSEWGPLLSAALPECEITVGSGTTRLVASVRDQAELFGLLERLRNLGAEISSVDVGRGGEDGT